MTQILLGGSVVEVGVIVGVTIAMYIKNNQHVRALVRMGQLCMQYYVCMY